MSEQRYACARPPVNGDCCARLWEMKVSKAELAGRGAEQHSSVLLHTEIMSSSSFLFFFFNFPLALFSLISPFCFLVEGEAVTQ